MAPEKREFIDPNELMRYINEVHSYAGLPVAAHVCTMELLTYAPRVDAVEVVRCKDCIHYDFGVCLKIYSDGGVSQYAWQARNKDDFCSYGERISDVHKQEET